MKTGTVAGYLISTLFTMLTIMFVVWEAGPEVLFFGSITVFGYWLASKESNLKKLVIVIGVFGIIGYIMGWHILRNTYLGSL